MNHKLPEPLDILTPAANGRWTVAGVLTVGSFREALDLVLDNLPQETLPPARWVATTEDRAPFRTLTRYVEG